MMSAIGPYPLHLGLAVPGADLLVGWVLERDA